MKGVLKVSVEIVRVCGEKRRSDWSSTERCAESEGAESESPCTTNVQLMWHSYLYGVIDLQITLHTLQEVM